MNKHFMFGSTLCQLMDQIRPLIGKPLAFCFFYLFIYKLIQRGSVENIVQYHKNITKITTIWHTVVGISGYGVCGFVVCVVGVWGSRQALNRIKINRLF